MMQQIDLPRLSINQTIQLKINELLNRSMHQVNLQHQQCFQEQLQNRDLIIYPYSNRFQSFQKPFTISKSQKAIVIKNNRNEFSYQVIGILTFFGTSITLLNKMMNQVSRVQMNLNKNQEIIEMSECIIVSGQYICFVMTNNGRKLLVICKENGLFVQEIQQPPSYFSYLKVITKPFSAPPRFYQYCKVIIIAIEPQILYLMAFKDLSFEYFFLKFDVGRSGLQLQRTNTKWEKDLEDLVVSKMEKRIKVVWDVQIVPVSYGKIRVMAGCDFQHSSGNNTSSIIMFQLDISKSQAFLLAQWKIPFDCDYHHNQVIRNQDFVYVLAHEKVNSLQIKNGILGNNKIDNKQSFLYKLGIEGLKQIRKYQVPNKCSLSEDKSSVLLLTELETYIVCMDQRLRKDTNEIICRKKEQQYQMLQKQSVKSIQKQIDSKNYKNIRYKLEQKKKQYLKYRTLHQQNEDGFIDNERLKVLEEDILSVEILIQLLEDEIDKQMVDLSRFHQVLVQCRHQDVIQLLQYSIKINPFYFIRVADKVLVPQSKKDDMKCQTIQHFYYFLFENCINKLINENNIGSNQQLEKIIQLAINIRKNQELGLFQKLLKKGKAQFLKKLLKFEYSDQQLFILLFCESKVLSNDQLRKYIEKLQRNGENQFDISRFIKRLVNSQIQSIKNGVSARPDMFFIQSIPQKYYNMLYNHLLLQNKDLAWILGLKLRIRNKSIGDIAIKQHSPIIVQNMLKIVRDKKDYDYKLQEIMAKICSHLNIKYTSFTKFTSMLQSGTLVIDKNKNVPLHLWKSLKETVPQLNLTQIEKKIKIE